MECIYRKTYMGTAAKKPRPMRSRRSGIKKAELIKKNNEILDRLAKDAK